MNIIPFKILLSPSVHILENQLTQLSSVAKMYDFLNKHVDKLTATFKPAEDGIIIFIDTK